RRRDRRTGCASRRVPVQRALVEELGPGDAALLAEVRERTPPSRLAEAPRSLEIASELDDRARQRLRRARLDEQPRLAVPDELAEPADVGGDHRPTALHRLERHHAEALAERRHDEDRRVLDRPLDRRYVAEEAHGL